VRRNKAACYTARLATEVQCVGLSVACVEMCGRDFIYVYIAVLTCANWWMLMRDARKKVAHILIFCTLGTPLRRALKV
jgi:hypothetical protein